MVGSAALDDADVNWSCAQASPTAVSSNDDDVPVPDPALAHRLHVPAVLLLAASLPAVVQLRGEGNINTTSVYTD